jgi:hypothetical protein
VCVEINALHLLAVISHTHMAETTGTLDSKVQPILGPLISPGGREKVARAWNKKLANKK